MAYNVSTGVPGILTLVQDGFSSNLPRIYSYQSSHASTDIVATGFFSACGDGGRSANNVGLRPGDVVINRASTNPTGGIAGRVTMHSVIATTVNVTSTLLSSAFLSSFGFDATVASAT